MSNGSTGGNTKAWTVAIYMAADGRSGGKDLDQVAVRELTQIVQAACTETGSGGETHRLAKNIHVAVQLDMHDVAGILRFYVQENGQVIGSAHKEDDTATPEALERFMKWVATDCPARHYLFIFWGHSSGPVAICGDYAIPERKKSKAVTAALEAAASGTAASGTATAGVTGLTGGQVRSAFGVFARFAEALKKSSAKGGDLAGAKQKAYGKPNEPGGSGIDIVLFKECFMGMLETAFELEDAADYMIASQGRVPRLGWPYVDIFRRLALSQEKRETVADIKDYVDDVAHGVRQDLQAFYEVARNRRGKDVVSFSLVDVPALCKTIANPMKELVEALESTTRKKAVQEAFDRCSIGDSALVDLGSLCERLSNLGGESADAIQKKAQAVRELFDARDSAVTVASRSAFRGLSVFSSLVPSKPSDRPAPADHLSRQLWHGTRSVTSHFG